MLQTCCLYIILYYICNEFVQCVDSEKEYKPKKLK